jgi:hypothetical protein
MEGRVVTLINEDEWTDEGTAEATEGRCEGTLLVCFFPAFPACGAEGPPCCEAIRDDANRVMFLLLFLVFKLPVVIRLLLSDNVDRQLYPDVTQWIDFISLSLMSPSTFSSIVSLKFSASTNRWEKWYIHS